MKKVSEAAAKPCPKCGYCDHCGRSNHQIAIAPYVVPYIYPQAPYWSPYTNPFWVGGFAETIKSGMNYGTQGNLGATSASQAVLSNMGTFQGGFSGGGLQGALTTSFST